MDNHESYAKTWHRIFLFVGVFSILSGIALLIIFSQKVYFTASIVLDFAFILVGLATSSLTTKSIAWCLVISNL